MAAAHSIESSYFHSISTNFNKLLNRVRDQGAGGSNPLSPTNFFSHLQDDGVDHLVVAQVPEGASILGFSQSSRVLDARPSAKTSTVEEMIQLCIQTAKLDTLLIYLI
jgi:hypothetical protein